MSVLALPPNGLTRFPTQAPAAVSPMDKLTRHSGNFGPRIRQHKRSSHLRTKSRLLTVPSTPRETSPRRSTTASRATLEVYVGVGVVALSRQHWGQRLAELRVPTLPGAHEHLPQTHTHNCTSLTLTKLPCTRKASKAVQLS